MIGSPRPTPPRRHAGRVLSYSGSKRRCISSARCSNLAPYFESPDAKSKLKLIPIRRAAPHPPLQATFSRRSGEKDDASQNGMSSSIGPSPPPLEARAGRFSTGEERPKLGAARSSPAKLSPPPPRESSKVSSPRKRCTTTSVENFSTPDWSVHLRVCNWPSMKIFEPFLQYCSAILPSA